VEPQSSLPLALRARKLLGDRGRRRLADGLVRVCRSAQKTTPGFTAAVRQNAREVLAAQTVLTGIDRRLRCTAPVRAKGVAMLQALLMDGSSPLYQDGESGGLASQLHAAAAALEPQ
jgi:hypothetical protein